MLNLTPQNIHSLLNEGRYETVDALLRQAALAYLLDGAQLLGPLRECLLEAQNIAIGQDCSNDSVWAVQWNYLDVLLTEAMSQPSLSADFRALFDYPTEGEQAQRQDGMDLLLSIGSAPEGATTLALLNEIHPWPVPRMMRCAQHLVDAGLVTGVTTALARSWLGLSSRGQRLYNILHGQEKRKP